MEAQHSKVAPGSLLLFNILHGMMSNVEQSLYVFDVTQVRSKAAKQALTNHLLNCMLVRPQDTYKNFT